jgi:type II secretory pathway component PulC
MRSLFLCGSIALAACGGSAPMVEVPAAAPPTPKHASVVPSSDALPANALRRSAVREALAAGPGAFLQHVTIDDRPVFLGGKFHGFRVAGLRDASFWSGVDLRPGDVVTGVNGFPIEHPEEALEAFRSLDVSSELRVSFERDGAPRELRFAIIDDVPPRTGANPPRTEVH